MITLKPLYRKLELLMLPDLWVDKYAPQSLDEYIFQNNDDKQRVQQWIKQGWVDNLLLVGPAGTGKTSLARVLLNELKVEEEDIMRINAARNGNVDTIKTSVANFIQTGGWGSIYRYIIMNEADGITPVAQPMLNDDMEEYSGTVRWILTSNRLHKLIHPIQDRCTIIKIDAPDQEELINRLLFILDQEAIHVDDDDLNILVDIVDNNYPSVRKCIRTLQTSIVDGKLVLKKQENTDENWKFKIVETFKQGKIQSGREMIKDNMTRDDVENYIIWLANHLELFDDQISSFGLLRKALIVNPSVADPEINLSATLVEITQG